MLPENVLNLVSSPSRSFLQKDLKIMRHHGRLRWPSNLHYHKANVQATLEYIEPHKENILPTSAVSTVSSLVYYIISSGRFSESAS